MSYRRLAAALTSLFVLGTPAIAQSDKQTTIVDPKVVTIEQEQYHLLSAVNPANSTNHTTLSRQAQQASARSLIQQQRYKEVIMLLEKSRNLDKHWENNYWLGTAYLLTEQLEKASHALDQALKIKGNIAEIWIQRAIVEQEKGNIKTALQLFNVAQKINPKSAAIFLNSGYAYEQLHETDAARAAYAQFLKLSTDDTSWAATRKQILFRISRLQ